MTIASHFFLLLFLPLTVSLYYGVFRHARQKMFFLLFASYLFYTLANWQFVPLLLGLSLATFWVAKRRWITAGVVLNLAALGLFKYWNFGVDTFNVLMNDLGIGILAPVLQIGLPLGISFFVFKHIGYLIDIRQKRYEPTPDFWAFATFSAYFPQISAGPISSFNDTASQFTTLPQKLNREQAYEGLVYLSIGLAKKALVADVLGSFLATNLASGSSSGLIPAWYVVIAYAMQLYFDFSGYTDMVLGASLLFGISLPQNFNSPYLATSPGDFWERWHISLSMWFRYYLFFPISRSLLRKWSSSRREQAQYASNLITMTLIGLWHGAGWSYIAWGFYHGVLLNINSVWKRSGRKIPALIGRPLLVFALMIGWALFMSPDMDFLRNLFSQLFGFGGLGTINLILKLAREAATPALLVSLVLAFSGYSEARDVVQAAKSRVWYPLLWGTLAAVSLLYLGGEIQFLYVQF